ncbi:MAG: hypothetical protein U0804_01195 [Gemmataceae bacterium]
MGVQAISNDVAFATSQKVVRVFAPLLREEEQVEAMNEVYPLVAEALREFADRLKSERTRLGKPCLADATSAEQDPEPRVE